VNAAIARTPEGIFAILPSGSRKKRTADLPIADRRSQNAERIRKDGGQMFSIAASGRDIAPVRHSEARHSYLASQSGIVSTTLAHATRW